jgi:hypothetical protein
MYNTISRCVSSFRGDAVHAFRSTELLGLEKSAVTPPNRRQALTAVVPDLSRGDDALAHFTLLTFQVH